MATKIDLTRKRLGTPWNGRRIGTCPKCGRKGVVEQQITTHQGHFGLGNLCFIVTDHCITTADGKTH